MRKFGLYLFLFALVSFVACQKDPTQTPADPAATEVKGSVTFESVNSTEEEFGWVWEADVDRIGLFTEVNGKVDVSNTYYAAFAASEGTVTFVSPAPAKSIRLDQSVETCNVYAYYPYRTSQNDPNAISVSIPSEQNGHANNVSALKKIVSLYGAAIDVPTSSKSFGMDLKSVAAIIKIKLSSAMPVSGVSALRLTADAGVALAYDTASLNLADGTVTMLPESKTSNVVEYKFPEPFTLYNAMDPVYVVVNELSQGLSIKVELTCSDGEVVDLGNLSVPAGGIPSGSVAVYSASFGEESEVVDLSANGTANTYIVNKPFTIYKFKATVKGNGVARSFTWNETDGTQITRGYTEADLAIEPARVALLWYNTPKPADGWSHASPIVEDFLVYEDGYVKFLTSSPFVPGNAVIAAYDESNTIIWSWNIWAVEGYDPDANVRNVAGYYMMDRNLGAIAGPEVMNNADKREAAWAIGNYYQWGRKDPFPAAAEYDDSGYGEEMYWGLPTYTTVAELAQDFSGTSWGSSDMMFGSNAAANCRPLGTILGTGFTTEQGVAESIAYPYRWISYEGSDCRWNEYLWMFDYNALTSTEERGSWRYLWGAPEIDKIEDNDNEKTIYDPCPVGYKVAPAYAYAFALANVEFGAWGCYNTLYDIYFPYTGQRQAGFGGSQIRSLTNSMLAYSSACVSETTLYKGQAGGVTTWNTYMGAGYNIRCVKEGNGSYIFAHVGPRCVLIGDSISRMWNSNVPSFFTDQYLLGKGIDGQTTEQIKARFFNDVIVQDPKCVHIMCGINDMANNDGANRTDEGIFENIKEMAEMAAAKGIKVIIGSTPPANNIGWHDAAWNEANPVAPRVVNLNKMLKAYAEERGFVYADYHSVLKDDADGLKKEYQTDAVHPNNAGFAVMEEVFVPALEKALYNSNAAEGDGQLEDFDKEEWN